MSPMKLWLLRPVGHDPAWEPWYNKAFGYVVRAETEQRARELAEIDPDDWGDALPWTDPARATCVELTAEGDEEVIIEDFHAA